jgi:hypothetical protein
MKKIADIKTRHKMAKDFKDIMGKVKEISERYARYVNEFYIKEVRLQEIYFTVK